MTDEMLDAATQFAQGMNPGHEVTYVGSGTQGGSTVYEFEVSGLDNFIVVQRDDTHIGAFMNVDGLAKLVGLL